MVATKIKNNKGMFSLSVAQSSGVWPLPLCDERKTAPQMFPVWMHSKVHLSVVFSRTFKNWTSSSDMW